MTKATRETTKLNFITDQGSTRATVRWAWRRADRFDCAFRPPLRIVTGPSPVAVLAAAWPGLADESALGAATAAAVAAAAAAVAAAGSLVAEPDRRNVRAGEDRESGGGSGISHANAAGDRDAGSADTDGTLDDGTLDDGRPEGPEPDGPKPEGPRSEGPVPEGAVGEASSHDGFAADSAG
jgi:hypothetical protein